MEGDPWQLGDCEYTEHQLKSLTPWERSLLHVHPIIAPDGYIPNSVVRRRLKFATLDPAIRSGHANQVRVHYKDGNLKDVKLLTVAAQLFPDEAFETRERPESKSKTISIKRDNSDVEKGSSLNCGISVTPASARKVLPPLYMEESLLSTEPVSETGAELLEEKPVGNNTCALPENAKRSKVAGTTKKHKVVKKQKGETEGTKTVTGETKKIKQPECVPASESPEGELTLLQRITKEKWFPPGVPHIVDLILDELIKFIDISDDEEFATCCYYLVQLYLELHMSTSFLNMAVDKLSRRISSVSSTTRKAAFWTLKMLDISAQEITVFIWQNLLDVKTVVREELLYILIEIMTVSKFKAGLGCLMSSLGINGSTATKKEQRAAIQAISEHLQAQAESLAAGSHDISRQEVEMWLRALKLPQPMGASKRVESNVGPLDDILTSNGTMDALREEYISRLSNIPDMNSKGKKGGRQKYKKETRQFSRRRNQKLSDLMSKLATSAASDCVNVITKRDLLFTEERDGQQQRDRDGNMMNNGYEKKYNRRISEKNEKIDDDHINKEDLDNFDEEGQAGWRIVIGRKSRSPTLTDNIFGFRSGQHTGLPVYQDATATLASGDPSRQHGGLEESEMLEPNIVMPRHHSSLAFTFTNLHDQSQRTPKLPPLTYIWPDHSSLPGMTDLRHLQSAHLRDLERTPEYRSDLGEVLPAGNTVTTFSEIDEETDSGSLQMLWKSSEAMAFHDKIFTVGAIERQAAEISRVNVQGEGFTRGGRRDFQDSFPVISGGSFKHCRKQSCGFHCQQHKWATKKMHHYISISKFLSYTAVSSTMADLTKHGANKVASVPD